jgi:hypothetical protein
MKPPSGGPRIGPISAGTVSHAIALTSSALATERSSTRRPTGTIIAPPMPWRTRASTKPGSEPAKLQSTEPSMKTRIASRNTRLAPNRSAAQPLIGMNTARLNR